MTEKREPQLLMSSADAVDQWCEATRRLRGDVPLSEVCGFASRIESLVRRRLAERLRVICDCGVTPCAVARLVEED